METSLCLHGTLHGTFVDLLTWMDAEIEVLILDINSETAVQRAQLD